MYDGYLGIEETKLLEVCFFTDGLKFLSSVKTKVPIGAGDDADLRLSVTMVENECVSLKKREEAIGKWVGERILKLVIVQLLFA